MKSTNDIFICSGCHGVYPSAIADPNMRCFDCQDTEISPAHDALKTSSTETDRHYEEAGNVNEEMKLHQEKMYYLDDEYQLGA